ncbi:hypothetical protein KIPB_009875 [Kipferlia bialata]|uniref:F-box associated domain-containing protein n=1 Tax=Kipferlia bialata TaxID=797122 RepID=A0A391NP62_9EUKA|nr:hypothetical protein KIPB_009875 [Kipferlia bialata]|eukprot:g9875.t1
MDDHYIELPAERGLEEGCYYGVAGPSPNQILSLGDDTLLIQSLVNIGTSDVSIECSFVPLPPTPNPKNGGIQDALQCVLNGVLYYAYEFSAPNCRKWFTVQAVTLDTYERVTIPKVPSVSHPRKRRAEMRALFALDNHVVFVQEEFEGNEPVGVQSFVYSPGERDWVRKGGIKRRKKTSKYSVSLSLDMLDVAVFDSTAYVLFGEFSVRMWSYDLQRGWRRCLTLPEEIELPFSRLLHVMGSYTVVFGAWDDCDESLFEGPYVRARE